MSFQLQTLKKLTMRGYSVFMNLKKRELQQRWEREEEHN